MVRFYVGFTILVGSFIEAIFGLVGVWKGISPTLDTVLFCAVWVQIAAGFALAQWGVND